MTESRLKVPARAFALAAATLAIAAISNASPALAGSGGVGTGAPEATSASSPEPSTPDASAASTAKYDRIWAGFSAGEKRWAHTTAECESGGDPDAIGGGGIYRGAFQFMRSTWKTSPKSPGGDPIAHPYRTQAVVAVLLKRDMGTSPWPVCG